MSYLTGEFNCKLDAKGRMMIPSDLKKQLPEAEKEGLVINRGLENYLVIYTKREWDKKLDELSKLNEYDRKAIQFVRYFTAGATNLQPDGTGRVNLPKNLLDYAGITNEVVLTCMLNKVEVWDKKAHEKMISNEPENFAALAEEVMANKGRGAMSNYHTPVMLAECIEGLNIKPNGTYVDVTFGGGGHSREIMKHLGEGGQLLAFDQDADAQQNMIDDDRFTFIDQNFRYLKNFTRLHDAIPVDGILADLGVSSYQFDQAERGFSIRFDAELDMRMNQASDLSAKEVVNNYSEADLHRIFGMYGEVQNAKSLAKTIVTARLNGPIVTVADLKNAISNITPRGKENKYLAQVFQALRIEVNQELEALKDFLTQSADVLATGGRLVVMSYHSLEDRLVKNFIAKGKFSGEVEKDLYGNNNRPFDAVSRGAIIASDEEIVINNRARSAKLRIAVKK